MTEPDQTPAPEKTTKDSESESDANSNNADANSLDPQVAALVEAEVQKLKNEIVLEVMGTINPLLEKLHAIAKEGDAHAQGQAQTQGQAQATTSEPLAALQQMNKTMLETLQTQKVMSQEMEGFIEQMHDKRFPFSRSSRRGLKNRIFQNLQNSRDEQE